MCKGKHLDSTFIEIINQQNKKIILGCTYRHPCMNTYNDHFSYLSEKVLREKNKSVILMGDFNVELLRHKNDTNTADFHDQVYLYPLYHK